MKKKIKYRPEFSYKDLGDCTHLKYGKDLVIATCVDPDYRDFIIQACNSYAMNDANKLRFAIQEIKDILQTQPKDWSQKVFNVCAKSLRGKRK